MFVDEKRVGESVETKLEPWRQLLLDAADVMQQRGKCENAYTDARGHVCILGAVNVVCGFHPNESFPALSTPTEALFALSYLVASVGQAVHCFNDSHTEDEVIAAMRACARRGI